MRWIFLPKLKEALMSVLPVVIIVLILAVTPLISLTLTEIFVFCGAAVMLIFGIALFSLGADIAMTPMGEQVGSGLTKTKKVSVLLPVVFVMGLLITVAEPDLTVLANQVSSAINSTALIVTVGVGVGLFLLVGILKIIFHKNLSMLLMFFYMALFCLSAVLCDGGKMSFFPMSFDSGGVTTGPITVPFIMALGVGVAGVIGGRNANENSFGLVALCSIGPMIAVIILSLLSKGSLEYAVPTYSVDENLSNIPSTLLSVAGEVLLALGLIVVFFFILQAIVLKLPKKKLKQMAIGIAYTYLGLVIFLVAVNVGFMPIGDKIGRELAKQNEILLIVLGFVIGAVVVLAEPAVHVLNKQVEKITGGTVSKKSMLIALSIGVGVSIGLSMIRIIFGFSLLYYVVPGYLISLGLSFFVPKIYTAIAFDSGGVASGPLTSTFILPLAIGACDAMGNDVLSLAFGVVAMVAMTPLITIQALGFRAILSAKVRERIAMKRIISADDEQIIDFM